MKILSLNQNSEEWLEFRKGKIGGSNSKTMKPLSRGTDRTPQGVWTMLAERVADNAGGEAPIDRGRRLEAVAIANLVEKYNLKLKAESCVWVSDTNDNIYVSPDGCEDSDTPTWAAEAKCLSSANHLKFIYKDLVARVKDDYKGIDSVPNEGTTWFRDQVIHYFVVNEHLQTLYFVLYDDRISPDLGDYQMHVITVTRQEVQQEVDEQLTFQQQADNMVNQLIAAFATHGQLPEFGFRKGE